MILAIDGREPASGSHATRILATYQPGEKLTLRVLRQHKTLDLETTLPERAEHRHAQARVARCASDPAAAAGPCAAAARPRTPDSESPRRRACNMRACAARISTTNCLAELIAQTPLAERSASRLLVLDGAGGAPRDATVASCRQLLAPGDLLVFNDTRVVPARLMGAKPSGGSVEIFLERALAGTQALAQLSASKPIRAALEHRTPPAAPVRVLAREARPVAHRTAGRRRSISSNASARCRCPPTSDRARAAEDRERYQSIFARERGAVAAPTASLHFDATARSRHSAARGVERAFVTLHVGAGTFQPLRVEDLAAHIMHAERVAGERAGDLRGDRRARARAAAAWWRSAPRSCGRWSRRACRSRRRAGALERGDAAVHHARVSRSGSVDRLLTNFHLPESTLLMLVCAFAGTRAVLAAYAHAIAARYRFFSYGDAMLLTRAAA